MANRFSLGSVELEVNPHKTAATESEPLTELHPDGPFRLLVAGDFSGHAAAPEDLIRVDRDNFSTILAKLSAHVELSVGSGGPGDFELKFAALEDFEPDSIAHRCEAFAHLMAPQSAHLYSEPEEGDGPQPITATAGQLQRLAGAGGLLDSIIEKGAPDEFQAMVQRIVAPYATPAASEGAKRAETERIQRAAMLMSHILHNERFQALEAAWRSLDLLVRRLDTDEQVHLFVVDCSREQLAGPQFKSLLENSCWNLLIANYAFDRAILGDVQILERMALLGGSLAAPFVAECLPSRSEDRASAEAWGRLRKAAAARYLGLAVPRFLLRLPYGKDTAPIDSFSYEEMTGKPSHNHYLWGNPAFLCALAIADGSHRIDNLPLHVYQSEPQPNAEVFLSENDCQALIDEGLIPLASVKGTDSIILPRLQAISGQSLK